MLIKFEAKENKNYTNDADIISLNIIYIDDKFGEFVKDKIFEIDRNKKTLRIVKNLIDTDNNDILRILISKNFAYPVIYKSCLIIPYNNNFKSGYFDSGLYFKDFGFISGATDIVKGIKVIVDAYKSKL